ncbi:MAG: hypothetical protein OXB95_11025, partial [Rhodobacteraceae bacterium]|nr:hypothetical protein [Paracoccaceae bacterium]
SLYVWRSALFQGMVSSIDNWNFVQRNTMLDGPITIRKAQKPTFQSGTEDSGGRRKITGVPGRETQGLFREGNSRGFVSP